MVIDVSTVDRETFNVVEKDGLTLITPTKIKRDWRPEEYHLRSLLVDETGEVVSSGFPKFFNFGEKPDTDASFLRALKEGFVTFADKLDGSLIIATNHKGAPHFRTRGNHDLGDFHTPVMTLIKDKYPKLLEYLEEAVASEISFLFEYTSPTNRIVVNYDEAKLYFLGFVDNRDLTLVTSRLVRNVGEQIFGVPAASDRVLPTELDALLKEVKSWDASEGVVARWDTEDSYNNLLKLKSDWYCLLHTLKFRFSGKKLRKFAYLTGTHNAHWEVLEWKLSQYGVDWEAAQFLKPDFEEFRERAIETSNQYVHWYWKVMPLNDLERKEYVRKVRELTEEVFWFSVAMLLYDKKLKEVELLLDGKVLDVSPHTLRIWEKNKDAEISALISAPVPDEE